MWKHPQMYIKSGTLGPHFVLENFKATDALDTADLKMLKLSGVLKYRVRERLFVASVCLLTILTGERTTSCS